MLLPYAVLEKALAFAKAGGVVVGYGIKPCNTPTRGKTSDDVRRVVDEIFAQPTALFLEGEPDGATLRAALAKNYPGEKRPLAVRAFDFPGLSAADGRMLAVNHYVKDGAQTLFIANQDFKRGRDLSVYTKWPADKVVLLWDPMQGTVEKPAVENGLVKLALEPSQAVFLVWPNGALGERALPWVGMPNGEVVAASVKETVTPVVIEGAEKESPATSLGSASKITRSPFAESVATELAFALPELKSGERVYFACDDVEGEKSAAVTVNGAYAGGFIGKPYRLDITKAVETGANTLETKPFRLKNPRIVIAKP